MNDPQTTTDATEAIRALLRKSPGAGPDRLAEAALSVIPDAIVEETPLQAMHLEALNRDTATFVGAGVLTLSMHRGDWAERGFPAVVYVTILDQHPARSAAV